MANATLTTTANESVASGLEPFARRAVRLLIIRTVLQGALLLLIGLLAAMWFDLVWPLPMSARWALTRLGLLSGIIVIGIACWWQLRRLTPAQLALWIDTRARTGGETLAGWQLERRPPAGPLSRGLAALAAGRAGTRLRAITPESVLPADPVRKSAWILCGAVLAIIVLSAIMPRLAWNQWQRFLFPARDVPPYTGVAIEIAPDDASVVYGDDISIRATVTSGRAESLELVTISTADRERSMPMLAAGSDEWQTVLTRITAPLEFYARSGRSRSRVGRLQVQMMPQIVATKVRITPPAYTKRPPYVGAIPKDGISGLAGTHVDFTITSNRPLRNGAMRLTFRDGSHEEMKLKPHAEKSPEPSSVETVSGSIRLEKRGSFDASVFDTDGLESLDHVRGNITITVDQRPVVRILEPRPLSLATPDVQLPVLIAAEDDFGLSALQLYRSVKGAPASVENCTVDDGPTENTTINLPLDQYKLSPGDEIKLFARAQDNDPAGAKGAESPVTIVRIISTEQFQAMMLQAEGAKSLTAKYEAAERSLEKLAEALRAAQEAAQVAAAKPDSKEKAAELQKKLSAAHDAAAEAAKTMRQISDQPMPIDVDRELAKRLAKMAGETTQAATTLGNIAKAQNANRPLSAEETDSLRKLAQQLSGQRGDFNKQALEPLRRLEQAMPLIADQQRFSELATQQRDLAQRLDSLRSSRDANDPKVAQRAAELEAEQQRLRESLDNLLDDVSEHADALPDVPELRKLKTTSKEFVASVRDSQARGRMSDAQQKLLSSDFPGAIDSAKQAADILESFLSKCNSMGTSACKSCELAFNPSAGCPALGNSIEQMLAMLGKKPGDRNGDGSGMGFGFGAGGGYSARSPGAENVGMYGSLPMTPKSSSRGRGDRQSAGMATNSGAAPQHSGDAERDKPSEGHAAGQAASNVPPQYRSQVAEYFRQLAEQLGEQQ